MCVCVLVVTELENPSVLIAHCSIWSEHHDGWLDFCCCCCFFSFSPHLSFSFFFPLSFPLALFFSLSLFLSLSLSLVLSCVLSFPLFYFIFPRVAFIGVAALCVMECAVDFSCPPSLMNCGHSISFHRMPSLTELTAD